MNRRHFLAAACLAAMLPMAGTAIAGEAPAKAHVTVDYTPGLIDAALAEGKTVFVDFAANWCSTCKRQERVIQALRAANPAYDEAMTFVRVDWDTYKGDEVTTARAVPRRSTLLVLRGDSELGRLVAATGEEEIKALMDMGLGGGS